MIETRKDRARAAFWETLRELDGVFEGDESIVDCQKADIETALEELFREYDRG